METNISVNNKYWNYPYWEVLKQNFANIFNFEYSKV